MWDIEQSFLKHNSIVKGFLMRIVSTSGQENTNENDQ